ncbi:MAG: class I SAM-dependent methyltransferase [Candidatus Woesearchaeota archaeon]
MKNGSVHRIWYEEPEIWAREQESRVERECAFLERVFKEHSVRTVLDVGCGAGSHCGYLHGRGYSMTGVDLNKTLIRHAKRTYPDIDFSVADQTKLSFTNRFDAIITLCTVIAYATTNEDLVTTLQNHNRALKRRGILIIDTFNPIVFIDKATHLREQKKSANESGYASTRRYSVDENNQLSIDEATFTDKNGRIVSHDRSVKRMTFPQEIRYFLEQSGFTVLGFYGDFDLRRTTLDGHRMVVIAQKTTNPR